MMLNISAVERETGLSKDVLRIWERRYAFPRPVRDAQGERRYSAAEVAKLRAVKRLMDAGMRPGRLLGRTIEELNALAQGQGHVRTDRALPSFERDVLTALRSHDVVALQHAITNMLMRQGVQRFVLETVAPLVRAVDDAVSRGDLHVFEEHVYREHIQAALRTAINAFPRVFATPRIVLTTLPGESNALGALMVEAVLAPEGAFCIGLGTGTPMDQIVRAAIAYHAHVLVVSLHTPGSVRQTGESLARLRAELPWSVALWAAGDITRRMRKEGSGVGLLPELSDVLPALRSWRAASPAAET